MHGSEIGTVVCVVQELGQITSALFFSLVTACVFVCKSERDRKVR